MIWAYLAGLATLPAGWILLVTVSWLTERNLAYQCTRCGRWFGVLPSEGKPTLSRITKLKFKWHRWTGKCKDRELNEY